MTIPFIVISGSMDDALLSRLLKVEANDALAKPLIASEICGMVQRMFSEPYVRKLDRPISTVICYQWFDG